MMEFLCIFFRLFTEPYVIISIATIGMLLFDRRFFTLLIFFLLINAPLNVLLKDIWQTPLRGDFVGWAFPSGHTQSSALLYIAIAVYSKRWWAYPVTAVLLCGMGMSMNYFGYHNWIEVFAAIGFSLILVVILFNLKDIFETNFGTKGGIALSLQLLLTILAINGRNNYWLYFDFSFFVGIYLGSCFYYKYQELKDLKLKGITKVEVINAIATVFIVALSTFYMGIFNSIIISSFVALFCGIWISCISSRISSLIMHQKIYE